MLVQSMHNRNRWQGITKAYSYLGALRYPKQWPGYLRRFALLGKRVHFQTRASVRFGIPVTLTQFEMQREYAVLELSGGSAIRVCFNGRGDSGRGRLCPQIGREGQYAQETTENSV